MSEKMNQQISCSVEVPGQPGSLLQAAGGFLPRLSPECAWASCSVHGELQPALRLGFCDFSHLTLPGSFCRMVIVAKFSSKNEIKAGVEV